MRPLRLRARLLVVACVAAAIHAAAAAASRPGIVPRAPSHVPTDAPSIAIVGGRVATQTDAGIVDATVLIEAGKIKEVGPALKVPDGAIQIDARGMIVTPGLIDAHSSLGLTAEARADGAGDGSLDVLDAVDPYDDDWIEVVRQGVTAVYVQPSAGTLGGRGAVLNLGDARTVGDVVVQKDAALHAAIGVGTAAGATLERRQQYEATKKALEAAKKYREDWDKYEAEKKKADEKAKKAPDKSDKPAPESKEKKDSEKKRAEPPAEVPIEPARAQEPPPAPAEQKKESPPAESKAAKPKGPTKPARDPAKEFIGRAMKRDVPIRIEAHRPDEIRHALRLADEFELRLVIEGATQPGAAAADLQDRRIGYVFGPMLEERSPPAHRREVPTDWPATLISGDTLWALGTFGTTGRDSRLLRAHAAAAVARGVPADQVLRAMTRSAAELLGVADRLGTIEPGKQADVAIFAGDPLDPAAAVHAVLIRGRVVYQRAAQRAEAAPARAENGALSNPHSATLPDKLPARFALKAGRVLKESGDFSAQTIVVENGRIVAARPDAAVPDGVAIFDLGDATVTPGLVTAHTDLGREADIDETAEADAANIRALDVLDLTSVAVRKLRAGGFSSALLAPGSRNVLAGCCAAVRLAEHDSVLVEEAGEKIVLGASARQSERYPASLTGQLELTELALRGENSASGLFLPDSVREQIEAERRRHIETIRGGQKPVFIAASGRSEIAAALQLTEQYKLRAVLVGPEEIEPFVAELKRLGIAIVARPSQPGDYDRYLQGIVAASQQGIPVAFGLGGPEELRLTAALAVDHGMSRSAALRGLTADAARILGADRQVGVIAPERRADLVIWTGSPIDLRSRVVRVIMAEKSQQ